MQEPKNALRVLDRGEKNSLRFFLKAKDLERFLEYKLFYWYWINSWISLSFVVSTFSIQTVLHPLSGELVLSDFDQSLNIVEVTDASCFHNVFGMRSVKFLAETHSQISGVPKNQGKRYLAYPVYSSFNQITTFILMNYFL